MNNLFRAGVNRLCKSKIYWVCAVIVIVQVLGSCIDTYLYSIKYDVVYSLEDFFYKPVNMIVVLLPIICSLFIGTEYGDGTIRNKLAVGHSRVEIYLSNFILSVMTGLSLTLLGLGLMCAVGIPMFGFFNTPLSGVVWYLVITVFLVAAHAAIFNLIAMLCENKTHTAVISIVLCFATMFLMVYLAQMILQPEMIEQFVMFGENGDLITETVKNPHYLTGFKRTLYQFAYDFIPTGQAFQISMQPTRAIEPPLFIGYSAIILLAVNAAGIGFFCKKDIK